jgi:hypothetical protein
VAGNYPIDPLGFDTRDGPPADKHECDWCTGATIFAMQHVSGRKSVSHLNRKKIFAGYISCCLEMWLEGVKLCAQCRHPALTTGAFEGV